MNPQPQSPNKPELESDKKNMQAEKADETFPMRIPESQGDLADQANDQIEAELQAQIEQARHNERPQKRF